MGNTTVRRLWLLCAVMYLEYVLGRHAHKYVFLSKNEKPDPKNLNYVFVGSNVTLVCINHWSSRVTWYRWGIGKAAAYIDHQDNDCVLSNSNYPSIALGNYDCKEGNYSIKFSSINYTDSGWWYCTVHVTGIKDKYVNINVTAHSDEQYFDMNPETNFQFTTTLAMLRRRKNKHSRTTGSSEIISSSSKIGFDTTITSTGKTKTSKTNIINETPKVTQDIAEENMTPISTLVSGLASGLVVSILLLLFGIIVTAVFFLRQRHLHLNVTQHHHRGNEDNEEYAETDFIQAVEYLQAIHQNPVKEYGTIDADDNCINQQPVGQDYEHMYSVIDDADEG